MSLAFNDVFFSFCTVFCYSLPGSALQPTVVRGNWRAYDGCSSRSSRAHALPERAPCYSRGDVPECVLIFPSFASPLANYPLFSILGLWQMSLRPRGTCCSSSCEGNGWRSWEYLAAARTAVLVELEQEEVDLFRVAL